MAGYRGQPRVFASLDQLTPMYRDDVAHACKAAGVPAADFAKLSSQLAGRTFPRGTTIIGPGGSRECHFIKSGLIAILFGADEDEQIGVSLLGADGFLGIGPLLGVNDIAHTAVALTNCSTLSLSPADLRRACDENGNLKQRLLQYAYIRTADAMQSAVCHLQHPLERRLASWILTASDLLQDDAIQITHRGLSALLGVRRPTMTIGLQNLEGNRAIWSRRSTIIIRDRSALLELSCNCYAARQRLRRSH
jgi:CRP-like cAMP-binding protein